MLVAMSENVFSPIWKVRISEMFLNWGDTVYHPIQNWDMSFGGFKVKRNRREWLESKLQQWWDIFQCIVPLYKVELIEVEEEH